MPNTPQQQTLRSFLRATGLGFVDLLQRHWKDRKAKRRSLEEPKAVLIDAIWPAIARTAPHLLPVTTLVVLIVMNYKTLYIGPDFTINPAKDAVFLAGIQLAAKLEELLCIASLTSIVLHALRRELLSSGLPLGLLGSATYFGSVSSLVSPDFLAAAPWSATSIGRLRFYVLLVVSSLLAVTIGPATAVLMSPRNQDMPAGSTSYFLNAPFDEYWPINVTSQSIPGFCVYDNASQYAVCPLGGWQALRNNLNTLNASSMEVNSLTDDAYAPPLEAEGITGNREWTNLLVQTYQNVVPAVMSSVRIGKSNVPTAALQPHAATVTVQQQLLRLWYIVAAQASGLGGDQLQWTYDTVARSSTLNPSVRVVCSPSTNMTANATIAYFPYLYNASGATAWSNAPGYNFSVAGLNRTRSTHVRAQWTSLPETFGITELNIVPSGLFVELPWLEDSRVAFGCSVAASWHNSTISSDRSTTYDAWSVDLSSHDANASGELDSPDALQAHTPMVLHSTWLEMLAAPSPAGSLSDGSMPNAFEQLLIDAGVETWISDLRNRPQLVWGGSGKGCYFGMMNASATDEELWEDNSCNKGNRLQFIEYILASYVADALSRYGSHTIYETAPDLRDWSLRTPSIYNSSRLLARLPHMSQSSLNRPSQWMCIYVVGYSYYASQASDYLALAVACVYIAVALSYVLYIYWGVLAPWRKPISSDAWQTVTELLILCQNSPPTPSRLHNASSGIAHLSTYATVVKVRAVKPLDGSGKAELRLVVDDDRMALLDGPKAYQKTTWKNVWSEMLQKCQKAWDWRTWVAWDTNRFMPRVTDGKGKAANDTSALINLGAATAVAVATPAGHEHLVQRHLDRVEINVLYG